MVHRRDILKATAAAAGAGTLKASSFSYSSQLDAADEAVTLPTKRIDTNASLFQWPFRRLPLDDSQLLVSQYQELGFTDVWVGSFEAIFHRDISSVNRRLAAACADYQELSPIGAINPTLPDWEEDLRRCYEDLGMHGIRLLPNYHGYSLTEPRAARLAERAGSLGLLVQIAMCLEDVRTQHERSRVEDVNLESALLLARQCSRTRFELLNLRATPQLIQPFADLKNVWFDSARVDSTDGIRKLLEFAPDRIVFGTHTPFLIPQAALIRLRESRLNNDQLARVLRHNASQLRTPQFPAAIQ